ncbi:hypothetical protein C8F04DRAFT_679453 [Mycena alexandri]|uniref:Cytochrome c biogenesis C n=1 Tax=Mycena alexandri TaxID=1745969 RepID=A0AAD6TH52_9AGAR|nr:hypothetical protein C8F04DRAFT_679453 [Mycena alexandri]
MSMTPSLMFMTTLGVQGLDCRLLCILRMRYSAIQSEPAVFSSQAFTNRPSILGAVDLAPIAMEALPQGIALHRANVFMRTCRICLPGQPTISRPRSDNRQPSISPSPQNRMSKSKIDIGGSLNFVLVLEAVFFSYPGMRIFKKRPS